MIKNFQLMLKESQLHLEAMEWVMAKAGPKRKQTINIFAFLIMFLNCNVASYSQFKNYN